MEGGKKQVGTNGREWGGIVGTPLGRGTKGKTGR